MASVQETIDALYIAHKENLISDEEFILVFDEVILKMILSSLGFRTLNTTSLTGKHTTLLHAKSS